MNDGGTTDASFALCIYALYRESTCISFIENDGENSMELANPTFESRIYTIVLFDKETLQSTLSVYLPLTPKEKTADKFVRIRCFLAANGVSYAFSRRAAPNCSSRWVLGETREQLKRLLLKGRCL